MGMKAQSRATGEHGRTEAKIAAIVRDACVQAALEAYETARMDGLCHEGAWEIAVGAMRSLDVTRFTAETERSSKRRGA
jgi:hypothetical protein